MAPKSSEEWNCRNDRQRNVTCYELFWVPPRTWIMAKSFPTTKPLMRSQRARKPEDPGSNFCPWHTLVWHTHKERLHVGHWVWTWWQAGWDFLGNSDIVKFKHSFERKITDAFWKGQRGDQDNVENSKVHSLVLRVTKPPPAWTLVWLG